jgi:diaminopimelate decarboxylase
MRPPCRHSAGQGLVCGVGKTAHELALALDEGILCVNVESEGELELLASIAAVTRFQ